MDGFITKIRQIILDNTSITKVYSPDLVVNETNIACVTWLGGTPLNNMNGIENLDVIFRVLFRGTTNDKATRKLAMSIFNSLHNNDGNTFTEDGKTYKIIMIRCTLPIYVGKDEELNNLYNTTGRATIKEVV